MVLLFAVVPGRSHPPVFATWVFCDSLCLADEEMAPQMMNLHEICFSKQENFPFYTEFQCHTYVLCQQEFQEPVQRPAIPRLPNMSTTVSGFAAKVNGSSL